jgi:hypothetical protein
MSDDTQSRDIEDQLRKGAKALREAAMFVHSAVQNKDKRQEHLAIAANILSALHDAGKMAEGIRTAGFLNDDQIRKLGNMLNQQADSFEASANQVKGLMREKQVALLRKIASEQQDQQPAGSVLDALENKNSALALVRIRAGGNLYEEEQHGNMPLHYAAAHGYMDVVLEIVARGFPVYSENRRGQTALVYSMEYGHLEISKVLWKLIRENLGKPAPGFLALVFKLCDIGVNERTLGKGQAESGFFQKSASGEFIRHPRARQIGEELNSLGGFKMMHEACERVANMIGRRAITDLSCIWSGVGDWMH